LRAFSNVLPPSRWSDRAWERLPERSALQYHGWTYTLDGRLIGTPDVEGVEFFDRSTMGMSRFAAKPGNSYFCEFRS